VTESASDTPTVLVVDDEPEVADVYAFQLGREYETEVAYGGPEALETIDETVDVVLLDRRMPDRSGDEVLAEIRDRGLDCRVIMVTAIADPDFDILEMPFNDYLCKPVESEDLFEAVEQALGLDAYDDRVDEFFSAASKRAVLEDTHTPEELAESDEFVRLTRRIEELRAELDEQLTEFDEMETAFQTIDRGSG
jgi:CheY-like chemotaxis protein